MGAQKLENDIPVEQLVDKLLTSMQTRDTQVVRTACLQWICMLLAQSRGQMLNKGTLSRIYPPIFETLLRDDDEVVVAALRVLAQIMEGGTMPEEGLQDEDGDGDLFTMIAHRLIRLFASDRNMLETRGRLMIRQLCGHLDPRRLYVTVAKTIKHENDKEFAQQLVQTFSWILLTAVETKSLRDELLMTAPLTHDSERRALQEASLANTPLFLELLEPWFHNPVSALALCLWAQQYEMATELTARFAAFEPTLDLLKQLDQLVHLLESPVFSRLRLQLLEPRRHPALLKCLLGLAMLLPQAGAFNILRERIHVVQSGLLLDTHRDDHPAQTGGGWWSGVQSSRTEHSGPPSGVHGTDINSLLRRFDEMTTAVPVEQGQPFR